MRLYRGATDVNYKQLSGDMFQELLKHMSLFAEHRQKAAEREEGTLSLI